MILSLNVSLFLLAVSLGSTHIILLSVSCLPVCTRGWTLQCSPVWIILSRGVKSRNYHIKVSTENISHLYLLNNQGLILHIY